MTGPATPDGTLTVGDLARLLRRTLDQAFPSGVWVAGEINGLKRSRKGHAYFNLVERNGEGQGAEPAAVVSVVLFQDDRQRVNRMVKRYGNKVTIEDGVQIRIQAMVDFYARQGRLQLRMTSIDPAYTLGAIAAGRAAVLAKLDEEGLLAQNAKLALPPVPLSVGLVTSMGSAAHADMRRVLEASGFGFTITEVDTAVQGPDAPREIGAAISAAADRADIVVLGRGGGSSTDLATFDHEIVARAIATCSKPVLTGIGHETDTSAADQVAHTSCSTPTAAARAVVQRVEAWLERLDDKGRAIEVQGRRALAAAESRTGSAADDVAHQARAASRRADRSLDAAARRLAHTGRAATAQAGSSLDTAVRRLAHTGRATTARTGHQVAAVSYRLGQAGPAAERRASSRLDRASARLSVAGRHEIRHAQRHLDAVATRVRVLDPALILRRGWSLTRRDDGTLLRSVRDVSPGDGIVTHLADGTLDSTIHARPEAERKGGGS